MRRALLALTVAVAGALALTAGAARAADECKGLQVCIPVEGPWVTVSSAGADWELPCPLPGYVVGGTDARVTTADVDVSFRGETGSPVGPGVTTKRSLVFHGVRTGAGSGTSSFKPSIGCIPSRGGGGRCAHRPDGERPRPEAVGTALQRRRHLSRPPPLAGHSRRAARHAPTSSGRRTPSASTRRRPPTAAQRRAIRVNRSVVEGVVVARVRATDAAGESAKVQVRALCSRAR